MRRRAIVVLLDGLRRDMVGPETTPKLHRFSAAATSFAAHRSAFPSATRVVCACFATCSLPARHGLQGNSGTHDARAGRMRLRPVLHRHDRIGGDRVVRCAR